MRIQILIVAAVFALSARTIVAAPAPKPPKPTVKELKGLLGKDHFSPEMYDFRELMKESPKAFYHKDFGVPVFAHQWESKGMELMFDGECKLESVILYAGFSDSRFKTYKGELPAGLSFADSPDAIKKKLGEPEEVNGGRAGVSAEWTYDRKGLFIQFDFDGNGVFGPKTRITIIGMKTPEAKKALERSAPGAEAPP